MPSISVVPWHCRVSHTGPSGYSINPDDCTIVVQSQPQAGAPFSIRLPDADSEVPPAGGDFYLVADPLGVCDGSHKAAVTGGTYSIEGAFVFFLGQQFGWAAFQFDGRNRKWAVFQGTVA